MARMILLTAVLAVLAGCGREGAPEAPIAPAMENRAAPQGILERVREAQDRMKTQAGG